MICIVALVSFLGYKAKDFRLDASAETLVLENDEALRYSRLVNKRYGESDYLVIAYTPGGDLFSDETLNEIRTLQNELKQMERVSSVVSSCFFAVLESHRLTSSHKSGDVTRSAYISCHLC